MVVMRMREKDHIYMKIFHRYGRINVPTVKMSFVIENRSLQMQSWVDRYEFLTSGEIVDTYYIKWKYWSYIYDRYLLWMKYRAGPMNWNGEALELHRGSVKK